MARAYSLDLRQRVVGAVEAGGSCRSVAATFGVSVASVVKWSQRLRATGSVAAWPMGGRKPYSLAPERDWILSRVAAKSDLTLHSLMGELADRGTHVCCDTLWRFLRREGISFKKNRARHRAGSSRRGAAARAMEATSGKA